MASIKLKHIEVDFPKHKIKAVNDVSLTIKQKFAGTKVEVKRSVSYLNED
ncbi:hypothetical protein GCM10022297_03520 [Lactobacillus hamsteri]|nr:hypothetical protein [Lactobacillus hamsteri]